jgi:large subunit ribosomal protein L15
MKLNELSRVLNSTKKKKRVGRGRASGHGKTSCRGQKGQKARAGGGVRRGFEGGQMPLQRRTPKRGFHNIFKKQFALVKTSQLEAFASGDTITPEKLMELGIVRKLYDGVKVLNDKTLTFPITVQAHKFSQAAKENIEAAGGKVEVI